MVKKNNVYPITSVILLIAVIVFAGLYFTKSVSCPEIEEKALLDAQVFDWAINEDNTNEMFFDYWIYNYGEVEAKNIVVRCDLWNEDGTIIVATTRDNYGNLASLSADFGEVITEDVSKEGIYYIPLCYIESCDNCEILYKRIPDLIESYEG